jgi:hypothetical protein
LLRLGTPAADLPKRLGIKRERWGEIIDACSQRVVAMDFVDQDYRCQA